MSYREKETKEKYLKKTTENERETILLGKGQGILNVSKIIKENINFLSLAYNLFDLSGPTKCTYYCKIRSNICYKSAVPE